MLRACAIKLTGSWDNHLPLIEFAYNNRHHYSIQIDPYKALFGGECRSLIGWLDIGETELIGPDMIQQVVDKVKLIREGLLAAQSRQKSYADKRRRLLEFQVSDWVYLESIADKRRNAIQQKDKLSPRYIRPY